MDEAPSECQICVRRPAIICQKARSGSVIRLRRVPIIALLAYLAIRLSDFIFSRIEDRTIVLQGFSPDLAPPTAKLVRLLLMVLALVVAFLYRGENPPPTPRTRTA